MKALLFPNMDKKDAYRCTINTIKQLNSLKIDVLFTIENKKYFENEKVSFLSLDKACEICDFIIAIGGDGTMLHAAKYSVSWDKPMLGINLGRLGYMANIEASELSLLGALKSGGYKIEERMLLECTHYKKDSSESFYALNDVVISNGSISKITELDVWCDGKYTMSYRSDGLILSTPTGSTAYALSAGGPLIQQSINCIALTPICPHSLFARTVIFKEDSVVTVKESRLNLQPIYTTIDGESGKQLEKGDSLVIKKADKKVKFIMIKDTSFYDIVSQKFKLNRDYTEDLR